ncbi:hypothetical protein L6164_015042 [Bauhinia variegata]|uniref:Uncharacterized protein n=1 Tax=Bauhinia variegata TaxID=167791 RepID=A0ACB9NN09_BAUVA|nr:hypothetical protein L6164_015042 [Bauhinia variegata]
MTMVPAHKLSKQEQQNQRKKQNHHLVYGSGYGDGCGGGYATETTDGIVMSGRIEGYNWSEYYLGSDLAVSRHSHMAEDESTSNSFNEAAGSSEGRQDNKEQPWLSLQLSIGCQTASPSTSISTDHHDRDPTLIIPPTPSALSSGLVELDLLPSGAAHSHSLSRPFQFQFQLPETSPRAFLGYPASVSTLSASTGASILQQQTTGGPSFAQHQEINWAFGPLGMPSSSSWRPPVPLGSYFPSPLQFPAAAFDVAGPSSDIKVVDPPRRHHTGIWFMLQASHNQAKEPFLPQIPKSYLRIKDGRMTVRLLMKYLVNKLRLESESEIEIRCRGQQLVPLLTLEHVRDNIWTRGSSSSSPGSRDAATTTTLLSESSTTNHIMVLHYGRSASS